jgi:hypothetical protein
MFSARLNIKIYGYLLRLWLAVEFYGYGVILGYKAMA